MYITYETAQYAKIDNRRIRRFKRHYRPPETVPNDLPKPEFMPTKLIRISDMEIVYGSQVNEGYCALSYSWNQSGDMVLDEAKGKYMRIDEGRHEIISYCSIFPDMIIPYYIAAKNFKRKLWKIYKVLEVMDEKNYYFQKTVKQVKFESILQHICQQFNIKYIWFDQMCINQDDKEEKKREIRNMHHIYENAYCTIALTPEFSGLNVATPSSEDYQYFKRLWTLEEAIKSKKLLFVGKDVHKWGEDISRSDRLYPLIESSSTLSVSQILYHAHNRTSTKDHDRVFALIHLFPEFMQDINIDYDQPLEELMVQFYRLLAKKSISILVFEKLTHHRYESTIQKYSTFLPSWTGVNGTHALIATTTSFQNYDVVGKTMHVTSAYVTKKKQPIFFTFIKNYLPSFYLCGGRLPDDKESLTIQKQDLPPSPDDIYDVDNKHNYQLSVFVQLPGIAERKRFKITPIYTYNDIFINGNGFDLISKQLQQLSRFMEIKKENLGWCHLNRDDGEMAARIDLDHLTENILDDPFAHYVLLSEILFKSNAESRYHYYPVVKKKQGEKYYKVLGRCSIESIDDIFSNCNLPKKTFLIQ
ncbi:hypothetical protein BDA99DRAFT_554716 [Phascolomyces articulosus]|uniref:Heterokaryon incompatibility domain-containing protein n=1 Tax=Phascolomyces articulosus TaxID=60185 RepID=A0AAD5KAB1_9FUNG|nr:hypothetical protein BDA99DRAFT_554716 [Phascolomyces articulosus]